LDASCLAPPATKPEESAGNLIPLLFGLAPGGVYLASRSPGSWCALTAPLHPCRAPGGEKAFPTACL